MKKFAALLTVMTCSAADWVCAGGDAAHPGWQKHEQILSVESVGKLQLVVNHKLGDDPLGAPVMVGRLVTHKGIKDLVFIAGGANNVYALDPDLGTLFWQRRFEAKPTEALILGRNAGDADDDDDDISMGVRPLYLLRTGGVVLSVNAGSGEDLPLPLKLSTEARACAADSARKALVKWQTADNAWWSSSANAQGGVDGFKGAQRIWSSQEIGSPTSIAVANGVVFVLANGAAKQSLYALDAANGHELYRSRDEIKAPVASSGLAIANGHVCFGDTKGMLYCFGFPVDL